MGVVASHGPGFPLFFSCLTNRRHSGLQPHPCSLEQWGLILNSTVNASIVIQGADKKAVGGPKKTKLARGVFRGLGKMGVVVCKRNANVSGQMYINRHLMFDIDMRVVDDPFFSRQHRCVKRNNMALVSVENAGK